MLSSDKQLIQFVVSAMVHHNIKKVVLSPGSRNAPFAIAFDAHPQIETLVVHDERCAAFIALGWAQQSKTPVALCSTSGSACLNYYPAIAEAYYRNIPLLVITSDRPSKWINHGDGQTIVQKDVFKNHVHQYLEFDEENFELNNASVELLQNFLNQLNQNWKGPIHLNTGLNEPLYGEARLKNIIFPDPTRNEPKRDFPDFHPLSDQKIMILVGQMDHNPKLETSLGILAQFSNVVVLVENTSNLKHPLFNHCIDRSLNGIDKSDKKYHPDILITLGGAIVSKRIKAFLRQIPLKIHWRVAFDFPKMDTYGQLSACISIEPEKFISALLEASLSLSTINFQGCWKAIDYLSKDKQNLFVTNPKELYDYDIFKALQKLISGPYTIHLANSSVVRYAQLFDPLDEVTYYSNRGTSGIDGSVSTAIGAALASPQSKHILICGDTSFIYDSNSLWTSPFPKNLKIILINNRGGGIFQIIEGPATSVLRSKYFEASHDKSPGKIAEGFGFKVMYSTQKDLIDSVLNEFLNHSSHQIIELTTLQDKNAQILKDFFNFINS